MDDERDRIGRRSAIAKLGVGTAVAWSAPTLLSSPAAAQGSGAAPTPVALAGSSVNFAMLSDTGLVWASADSGDSWAAATTQPTLGSTPWFLTGGQGDFCIIDGALAADYTSGSSGLTWAAGGATGLSGSVTAFGGTRNTDFIAGDSTGALRWTSDAGATWNAPTTAPPGMTGVAAFLQCGVNDAVMVTSTNQWYQSPNTQGDTWVAISAPSAPYSGTVQALVGGSADYLVVDSSNQFFFTTDQGTNWAQASTPPPVAVGGLQATAGSTGNYVVIDSAGDFFYAPGASNGDVWAGPTTLPAGFTGPPLFLAGGINSFVLIDSALNYFFSSDGGDNWSSVTTPPA